MSIITYHLKNDFKKFFKPVDMVDYVADFYFIDFLTFYKLKLDKYY